MAPASTGEGVRGLPLPVGAIGRSPERSGRMLQHGTRPGAQQGRPERKAAPVVDGTEPHHTKNRHRRRHHRHPARGPLPDGGIGGDQVDEDDADEEWDGGQLAETGAWVLPSAKQPGDHGGPQGTPECFPEEEGGHLPGSGPWVLPPAAGVPSGPLKGRGLLYAEVLPTGTASERGAPSFMYPIAPGHSVSRPAFPHRAPPSTQGPSARAGGPGLQPHDDDLFGPLPEDAPLPSLSWPAVPAAVAPPRPASPVPKMLGSLGGLPVPPGLHSSGPYREGAESLPIGVLHDNGAFDRARTLGHIPLAPGVPGFDVADVEDQTVFASFQAPSLEGFVPAQILSGHPTGVVGDVGGWGPGPAVALLVPTHPIGTWVPQLEQNASFAPSLGVEHHTSIAAPTSLCGSDPSDLPGLAPVPAALPEAVLEQVPAGVPGGGWTYQEAWVTLLEACATELEVGRDRWRATGDPQLLRGREEGRRYLAALGQLRLAARALELACCRHLGPAPGERCTAALLRVRQVWEVPAADDGHEMALSAAAEAELAQVLGRQALAEAMADDLVLEGCSDLQAPTWEPGLCAVCLLPLDLFPALPTAAWIDGRPCLVPLANLWLHRVHPHAPTLRWS
eukprot:jgi/Botrbrau1/6121/Bobra.331_2s0016.1